MVKVGEFQRITQEEYRRIVSYQIPVTFFCVKLHGKATDITFGISCSTFARYCREADKAICLLTDFTEDHCFCVLCDVVCNGKSTECTGTFGMHTSFGDHFAVEVG